MNHLPKIALLGLVLALVVPSVPAASTCSELSIRNAAQVGPVPFDYGFDRLECEVPGTGGPASLLLGRDVQVTWFHDEAGLTDLTVVVSGPGVSLSLSAEESVLSDGTVLYETAVFMLPDGFQGELSASLYQGTTLLATAAAHTPL